MAILNIMMAFVAVLLLFYSQAATNAMVGGLGRHIIHATNANCAAIENKTQWPISVIGDLSPPA